MVAAHIEEIKHRVLFVTGVYLSDITNTFSPLLHLNVSLNSEHLLFLFICVLISYSCLLYLLFL